MGELAYLAEVFGRGPETEWLAALRPRLAPFVLEDGEVHHRRERTSLPELVGWYEAHGLEAMADGPGEVSRPFGGIRSGFLSFQIASTDDDARAFGDLVGRRCRGRVWRRPGERSIATLSLRSFPLEHVLDKYGFNDGDAIDHGDAEHVSHVVSVLRKALDRAGVRAPLSTGRSFATMHNPYRIHDEGAARALRGGRALDVRSCFPGQRDLFRDLTARGMIVAEMTESTPCESNG